jgi:aryl-alcohol dehydrogenase-like predicted oxidoreductase
LEKEEKQLKISLVQFRNKVVIATKFGIYMKKGRQVQDRKLATIWQSVEGSHKRLGVDAIDLYYQRVAIDMPISDLPRLSQLVEHHVYGGVYVS